MYVRGPELSWIRLPDASVRGEVLMPSRINSNCQSWLLFREEIERAEDESMSVAKLTSIDSPLATAARLYCKFIDIVHS